MLHRRIGALFSKSNPAITGSSLHVHADGSRDLGLGLRAVASGLADVLISGTSFESGLLKRTSITSLSTTVSSSSSKSPSSVMSLKCRVRPSLTAAVSPGNSDATVSIPSASTLVAGLTCVRLHLCKQFRVRTHTVWFRPGLDSSLKTHTPGPHHP